MAKRRARARTLYLVNMCDQGNMHLLFTASSHQSVLLQRATLLPSVLLQRATLLPLLTIQH